MTRVLLISCLLLAACTDPRLNAGLSIGPGGVTVTPSVSGRVGGVGIALRP